MSRINILLLISTWCSVVLAQNTTNTPEKVGGHLGYIPNTGAAVIFFLLYLSVAAHATWLMFRLKAKYMTALVVCGYIYALGLILRIAYGKNYSSLGLYVFLNMCTVLSPCGFIATVYVLLGRLSRHLYAEEYLLIRPNWITKIYVTSDVFTLLIQATGGAMAGSNDIDKAKLAGKIFLVGLILQLVSFASYMFVFGMFVYWMKTERVVQWNEVRTRAWGQHWKGLVWAVCSRLGMLTSLSRAMIASALLVGSVKAGDHFILHQCRELSYTRVDPMVAPGAVGPHVHNIIGGSKFGPDSGSPSQKWIYPGWQYHPYSSSFLILWSFVNYN